MTNSVIISTIASLVLIFVIANTIYYGVVLNTHRTDKNNKLEFKIEVILELTLMNSILLMGALFFWPFIANLFSWALPF